MSQVMGKEVDEVTLNLNFSAYNSYNNNQQTNNSNNNRISPFSSSVNLNISSTSLIGDKKFSTPHTDRDGKPQKKSIFGM